MEYLSLALLGLILVGVLYFGLRKRPGAPITSPIEPKPPSEPCIRLLGIAIRPPALPAEFDPKKFPPFYYPLGVNLCFEAMVDDCDPYDPLKVSRYTWEVHRIGWQWGPIAFGNTLNPPTWCWNGEGVGASCGQTEPIPMLVRCVAELTNGDLLEARREFWLVPHSGWK